MKLLAVETSSPFFSVAVSEGAKVLSFVQAEGQGRPSALLPDLIEQAAGRAGLTLQQMDGFAVSIGPGSFTGLRVGVMTVKTLAWALQKPAVPVSSMEVIVRNVKENARPALVFLDARKDNVYSALFHPDGKGGWKRTAPDRLLSPQEALALIPGPAVVVGDGLKRYGALLAGRTDVEQAPPDWWIPRADHACEIAAALGPAAAVDDIHRLVPNYLYA